MPEAVSEITRLLHQWGAGDSDALSRVLPLVYEELHRLAAAYLRRERTGHTLQPTALIHEAYLRLAGDPQDLVGRSHFVAIAARVMRQVLVEYGRSRGRQKRGGGKDARGLQESLTAAQPPLDALLVIHEGLEKLAAIDERKSEILVLKYFGGCTVEEIAAIKALSVPTVVRDQKFAVAWLRRFLSSSGDSTAAAAPA